MTNPKMFSTNTLSRDLVAGLVVFLVALPLCLGIALASKAPLFSGLLAGIVGGIVVGMLSGSQTSVSGPAAGLTAIVMAQIAGLKSFETFLLAVLLAGAIQIVLGMLRAGSLAAFFPSSVIKGLLAAIGVLLILKQIPHLLGHDTDPVGEMAFQQPDNENTFSEILHITDDLDPGVGPAHLFGQTAGAHLLAPLAGPFGTTAQIVSASRVAYFETVSSQLGAALIGLLSMGLLLAWDKIKSLKHLKIPGPLVVVLLGVGLTWLFNSMNGALALGKNHLVQVPVANTFGEFFSFLRAPDFSKWNVPAVYMAAFTIAIVASLETLLNLQAVDKLDPHQRVSPGSRELIAQGVGNMTCGLIGGIPVTSVVVRGSVNILAGGQTKLATILHGAMLLVSVMLLPTYINLIPLSCLAAILIVTGFKLASWKLFKHMWDGGRYQFIPFLITLVAIVFTDLLVGILIGLAISVGFILNSNLRRPIRRIVEKHLGGEVLHVELANQVSFLNRAVLEKVLREAPRGGHVLLDASNTDYIDPDILDLIRDFKEQIAPAHGVKVSLRGFRHKYQLEDDIHYVDYSTRELQELLTPAQVLTILREGNERFRTGHRLTRDLGRQIDATAAGQHPLAVVLSCIDSRSPAELIFDLGLGDIFSVRVAGNVISPKVLGSMEYACAVAGAKLILVVGHTRCGAVTSSVQFACSEITPEEATGCQHLGSIVREIKQSVDPLACQRLGQMTEQEKANWVNEVAKKNVVHSVEEIQNQSRTIAGLVEEGRVAVVGAMYDVTSGSIEFIANDLPHSEPVHRELLVRR